MAEVAAAKGSSVDASQRRPWPSEVNILAGLIAIALMFEVLGWLLIHQSFLINPARLQIMILQVAIVGIVAVGVTQVIITGGIDLSSGSVVSAAAIITMSFAQVSTYSRAVYPALTNLPIIVPIAVGLACGLLAGLINGLIIAYTKIPPFIATLGMMVSARGVSNWYTKGQPVSFPTDAYASIASGIRPVIIFIVIAIIFQIIMRYTLYGRRTYAIGSNADAARVSGINVERHLVLVYTLAGVLSAVAAIVVSSRNLTAQAGMGFGYELDAIAMTVIGGTSLYGGRGSIIGTVLGALIFGVIISGFTFLRIDAFYQEMIKGVIIIGAVVQDVYRQRRRGRI
ncbi:MAG: transporter permease [Hyphomicrobiales bacterium]|nr:transporter permease [Hyphomicrobiales bacterium]